MAITRVVVLAMCGVGLAASGVLLSQSVTGAPASPSAPVTAATPLMPMEAAVVRAADRAVLLQLCLDGQDDGEAHAYYLRARAAHPGLSSGIGPDCRLASPAR